MARLPDFIVIGAMKCATSTLHEQLDRQAGIFMSAPKEPNFFSDDDQYARGIDWYRSLFDRARPDDLCGESSTHYTKRPTLPHTVERLRRARSDWRFVYVIRHPIDRLVSQYIHEWTQRRITDPIEVAIDRHPELIDYSRYAMQLEPYFETFGPDRVLAVFFERLANDPQAELTRIGRFIGCAGEPVWDVEMPRRNESSARLRKSPIRDTLVNLPVLAAIRRAIVPRSIRDSIKRRWQMSERPAPSPETIARLHDVFDPDLGRLAAWCGVDLTCARYHQAVRGSARRECAA